MYIDDNTSFVYFQVTMRPTVRMIPIRSATPKTEAVEASKEKEEKKQVQ